MVKRVSLTLGFLVIFSGVASAKKPQPPAGLDCDVFVSTYDGGQIQCVKLGNKVSVTTIHEDLDGGFYPEDITQGPDKHIYVADPTNHQIIRINGVAGSNDFLTSETIYSGMLPFAEPQGPSFHGCDLYVSSEKGVYVFPNICSVGWTEAIPAPTPAVGDFGTGEGTDFRVNGDLVIADRIGKRVMIAGPPYDGSSSGSQLFGGFMAPIGIAVSPDDVLYVADMYTRKVYRCTTTCTSIKTFSGTDAPYFLEHDFDKNLWVATEDVDGNGKLWRFQDGMPPPNNPMVQFADFATKGKKPGAVKTPRAQGLAIPPTGTTCGTYGFDAGETADFDCGSYAVEVTSHVSCEMTLDVQQVFSADLDQEFESQGLIEGDEGRQVCVSDDYSNGMCAIFTDNCEGDKTVTVSYFRFGEGSLEDFPAVLRRDNADQDWQEETLAYLQQGLIPGDPGRTGGSRRSDITLADLEVDGIPIMLLPPFDDCPDYVYEVGSATPLKFQIFDEDGNVIAIPGLPRLSIQDVNGGEILLPSATGNSEDNIPSLSGDTYHYNLKLVQGFEPGHTYRLIVIAAGYLGPQRFEFTTK